MSTEPRTWQLPPEPEDVERVRDADGNVWSRDAKVGWRCKDRHRNWITILNFGPLTEVVKTEVEAAARRLREHGWNRAAGIPPIEYPGHVQDSHIVLAHVLNGGTL